jgi:CheY-like chemotaxis protein
MNMPRIPIVDDNPTPMRLAAYILELNGYEVLQATPRKGVRTLFCGWTVRAVATEQPWGQLNLTLGPSMNDTRRSAAS